VIKTRWFAAWLVLLAACAVAYGQSNQGAGTWETFISEPGSFSVLMPGKPEVNESKQDSPNGPYTVHLFTARADRRIYLVGWVDYDPSFRFDTQKELEANRDKFVSAVKAQLTGTTKPIKLGPHPGIEFTAETEQVLFRSRVYVVGRRPYQLIAVRGKGTPEPPEEAKFFSSFAVTPAK
jgi:hypothetical protein